ncbi:diaminopimelate decarboxylase [Lentzea tibetensis]|uniref:Diaminopimelate decarboxylase n=1 Tax=Lentzea tibetensis TaxID=2591470 RepID=A0A563F3C6_9PSEU|nr:diaminopimelate decarboxylase [Lentzea tibetensis]TWP54271.1 diaminopimelate decarboxylase [Lentzea tibetensis]
MSEYTVQGIPVSAIAEQFGTPCYVYDAAGIERAHAELRAGLDDAVRLFYSLKPNPNVSVVKLLLSLGTGVEVCSMGELHTALVAGAKPEDILFTGPGKSVDELRALIGLGVRAIICESFAELDLINELATRPVDVLLRVNPSFGVQGGRLTMAGKPRQFGIDEDQVLSAKLHHPRVRLIGIHVYTGTRILDADVIVENTWRVFDLAGKVAEALGFTPELVDVGGGIGLAYYPGETDPDPQVLTDGVNKAVAAFRDRFPQAQVALEPGRYLVGRAGIYVVKVRYVKQSRGERYVVTDGGTHQNMSAVGTGTYLKRNFPMHLLSDVDRPVLGPCHVTGPLLTPTDLLGKDVELPEVSPGDLIGVQRCGAYGPTASIAYMNGQGYPAEVLVHQGKALLVRRRDTPEDLLDRQIVVDL